MTSADPLHALARRLRALRTESWPGLAITQSQLAEALHASGPAISAYENATKSTVPPEPRLDAYATFFATRRSVSGASMRLLEPSELTKPEQDHREELLRELTNLRNAALGNEGDAASASGLWHFPDGWDVTIVPAELPKELLQKNPYADPDNPDYVELYRYADVDALVELLGHIRAINPMNQVNFRTASKLVRDDYTTHLVLLGGVDWNVATREVTRRIKLPTRQVARTGDSVGGFEVDVDGEPRLLSPVLQKAGDAELLHEDVALFYRGSNPFNTKRTVTICNGTFGRGTYGAVRALTDVKFRDRNAAHVNRRFAGQKNFGIITRVSIVNRLVVTPDWEVAENILHEWSEA